MSVEELRKHVAYDPNTGILTWTSETTNRRRRAGQACGSVCRDGYMRVEIDKRSLSCHRVAWALHHGRWPDGQIDHINRIKTDNRMANLREVDAYQNAANKGLSVTNRHGMKGVSPLPSGKWQAQATVFGVSKYLGCFPTKEEAHDAYVAHVRSQCGEFAGPFSLQESNHL